MKLDFVERKGETAEEIAAEVPVIIGKFTMAFPANNTNTNFRGLNVGEGQCPYKR